MIPKSTFEPWLATITQNDSLREISSKTAIPVNTLSVQISRGRIPATTALAVARAYHQSALDELAQFQGYVSLSLEKPRNSDVLLLVPMLTIFREILRRTGSVEPVGDDISLAGDTFARWLDRYAADSTRKFLSELLDMDAPNFSREVNKQSLNFDRIVSLGVTLAADARIPLIACGYLNVEEAHIGDVSQELKEIPLAELIKEISVSQKYLIAEIRKLEEFD